MPDPHTIARDAVQQYVLLNDILEITHKVPYGFTRLKLPNITFETFLQADYTTRHSTIILHCLTNFADADTVVAIINKSIRLCNRLLILEHNPVAGDWVNRDSVRFSSRHAVERAIAHLQHDKVYLGGKFERSRNIMYVVNTIDKMELNHLGDVARALQEPYWHPRLYAYSSERTNEEEFFPSEIRRLINDASADKSFYCVIGGLMFLEILAETTPRKFYLFDRVFRMCLYALVLIEYIKTCDTLEDFDSGLHDLVAKLDPDFAEKINRLWPLQEVQRIVNKYVVGRDEWRNVLYVGNWRKNFLFVKTRLTDDFGGIYHRDLAQMDLVDQIVYTSTIRQGHIAVRDREMLDNNIVVTCSRRTNIPVLLSPTFSPSQRDTLMV